MSIQVIRHYSPGTSSDGENYDRTNSTTYDFGKTAPRNLIQAVRFSLEKTGYEGYGAPVYAHDIVVDGHLLTINADFEDALEDPSWSRWHDGVTLTSMAKEILADHQNVDVE